MSTALAAPPAGRRLVVSDRIERRLSTGELTRGRVDEYRRFLDVVERELMNHRVVRDNRYTRWFQQGLATDDELRFFVQQFSVFSNQFLVAALLRVINSESVEQMHACKQILLNELGVIYRKENSMVGARNVADEDKDREGDPDLVSTEGTVNGGTFRFRAAHFEWLLAVAECLGLHFSEMGQRKHGRPATLHFCDELQRLYGNEDAQIAEGASFAVENWAAAGFWQELEDGLLKIKRERHPHLRIAFFTWHNRVEAQHAGHTIEELEDVYFAPDFQRDKFFEGGRDILDAVLVFW